MAIHAHAMELLKILKQYKDGELIREAIWENDSRAIFNIANPSDHVEKLISNILSDEMIKDRKLATSRIKYHNWGK